MILILGRSGRGKDTCAKYLTDKYGLTQVKSYTTRPKRGENEDTHIFISKEDVSLYEHEMAAYTKIGEYEYFATKTQVQTNDIYVIDPRGLAELKQNMPDEPFFVIYISLNRNEALKRAILRNPGNPNEEEVFLKRENAEDEQFLAFENSDMADIVLTNAEWNIPKKHLDSIAKVYLTIKGE